MAKITKATPAPLAKMEAWEEELALEAKAETAKETLGIPRITHRSGVLKIDGKPVASNKLPHAIVDYVFTKAYYEGEFDPDNPSTPVCYAFSVDGDKNMTPHEAAPKPQHDQCTGCPHNRFGTADRGRGKRCKDERRVAAIVETKDPDSIAAAEVRQYSVPPGSLRNWGTYLSAIKDVSPSGNVRSVLTELSTEPGENAYVLTFRPIGKLTKEHVQAITARRSSVRDQLMQPYPVIEAEEKPKRSAKSNKKID